MPNQFTHPWTPNEIDFLRNNIKKLTYRQMGNSINRSTSSIQSKIRYLPFQQKVKKYPVNLHFFNTWSPEMAYVLGFIAADGNICHSGRTHTLHIACDDADVIEKIKGLLKYEGKIHKKIRSNGKISYSLRICDPIIFKSLQKLNITERKSLTFTPPKIPKNLVRHFIRGYFDGDGSVSVRNIKYPSRLVVDIYSASLNMAKFLHRTIKQIMGNFYAGKIGKMMTNKKTIYYRIHLGQKGSAKLFIYMYKDINLYLERKYKKFIEGMNYDA